MSNTPTTETLNVNAAGAIAMAMSVVMILTFFVFFMSGSILSVIVFWMVLVLSTVVLWAYGFIRKDALFLMSSVPPPMAAPQTKTSGDGLVGMEVFHVHDNRFTYDEAPAACAAFGGNLATLEQINEAYNFGAEWCGYGWSAGGLALFPTQKATWEALQQEVDPAKRTACGHVGVNGGYFDPASKFGVNCYGYKPAASSNLKLPLPPPGVDSSAFTSAVNRFQSMLSSFTVSPYSRSQWSGYGALGANAIASANYGTQFAQNLSGLADGQLGKTQVTQKETFVAHEGMIAGPDPNRPGGYTYIHEPANVAAPTSGKAVPWYVNGPPMNGGTGPMGWGGGSWGDHGPNCGCSTCSSGVGPTGPPGPVGAMGPMGYTGPMGPAAVGTTVPNAAPATSSGPYTPTSLEKIFLDFAFQNIPVPAGTQVTASDVSQLKAKGAARPLQSPDRYAIDIIANAMENYRTATK